MPEYLITNGVRQLIDRVNGRPVVLSTEFIGNTPQQTFIANVPQVSSVEERLLAEEAALRQQPTATINQLPLPEPAGIPDVNDALLADRLNDASVDAVIPANLPDINATFTSQQGPPITANVPMFQPSFQPVVANQKYANKPLEAATGLPDINSALSADRHRRRSKA